MNAKTAKIITIYDPNPNYGNRLQNYAVQAVLEKFGLDIITVSFEERIFSGIKVLKYYTQKLTGYRLPGSKEYWKIVVPRILAFEKFNRKYIRTNHIKCIKDVGRADYFIIGSDQVWNPEWYDNCELKKDMFLLTFARPEQKVCFSPSFSIEKLPEGWKPWFEKWLADFPRLSVREEAGAKIIRELTGKNAEVTIDPTLMLDKEDWLKIASCPKNVDCHKKYILTYFLGGRSDRVNNDLKRYAKIIGAETYNMLDLSQPSIYKTNPSEFVYLISNATLVMTDSFHACVFSFLFGKPFLCYEREGKNNMMSRMDTLFEKFDLKRKYINCSLENELLECNYQNGYEMLEKERKKLVNFLENSMNLI